MESDLDPVNFVDLPVETLSQIFSLVKFDSGPFELDGVNYFNHLTRNTTNIKNLRLVCHKFAAVAAPLLMTVASCDVFEPESIAKLEQISHHPEFSRHVKTVCVRLGFYEAHVAKDMVQHLAVYLCWVWEKFNEMYPPSENDTLDRQRAWDIIRPWALLGPKEQDEVLPRSEWARDFEKTKLQSGNDMHSESMRALAAIHSAYQIRFLAQQRLRKSGDAIKRVGMAMARMPTATRLVLDDRRHQGPWHLGSLMTTTLGADPANPIDPSCLVDLAAPLSWANYFQLREDFEYTWGLRRPIDYYSKPPIDMVINLPVAVHQAGVRLQGFTILHIQLPISIPVRGADDPFDLAEQPPWDIEKPIELARVEDLAEVCRTLQVLEMTPGYHLNDYHYCVFGIHPSMDWNYKRQRNNEEGSFTDAFELFVSMTHESLRQVHLDLHLVEYNDYYTTEYSDDLFRLWPDWPNLEVLHITHGFIRDNESLLRVIRRAPKISEVRLKGLTLHSAVRPVHDRPRASWAHMLDALRDETPRLRKNGERYRGLIQAAPVTARAPREWDYCGNIDHPVHVYLRELFDEVDADSGFSKVDDYLRGAVEKNPLNEDRRFANYPCSYLDYGLWPIELEQPVIAAHWRRID